MIDPHELLAARTHHHRDYPLDALLAIRRRHGASIDVVIPARDEEETVGAVVRAIRPLVEVGLVDDLVVVDSRSRDATARVAAAAGARVVAQDDVLPEAGAADGKGTALWKGLAATSGDLVVFVDADLLDIGPHYVTGLVGPLLTDPGVALVKAFYDRPVGHTSDGTAVGGGRVTELLARPLLSAFWPQLAWLAQPLAGEYAGRRRILEQVPFTQHYGVELGLLVDVVERWGPEVLAQVDLDTRRHRSQDLLDLGRMSAQLLEVALDRLARTGRMALLDDPSEMLLRPQRVGDGLVMEEFDVGLHQWPPLADWLDKVRDRA